MPLRDWFTFLLGSKFDSLHPPLGWLSLLRGGLNLLRGWSRLLRGWHRLCRSWFRLALAGSGCSEAGSGSLRLDEAALGRAQAGSGLPEDGLGHQEVASGYLEACSGPLKDARINIRMNGWMYKQNFSPMFYRTSPPIRSAALPISSFSTTAHGWTKVPLTS